MVLGKLEGEGLNGHSMSSSRLGQTPVIMSVKYVNNQYSQVYFVTYQKNVYNTNVTDYFFEESYGPMIVSNLKFMTDSSFFPVND